MLQSGIIPRYIVLTGVTLTGEYAIAGGGFSDVYCGKYQEKAVALKVLREYRSPDIDVAERAPKVSIPMTSRMHDSSCLHYRICARKL